MINRILIINWGLCPQTPDQEEGNSNTSLKAQNTGCILSNRNISLCYGIKTKKKVIPYSDRKAKDERMTLNSRGLWPPILRFQQLIVEKMLPMLLIGPRENALRSIFEL